MTTDLIDDERILDHREDLLAQRLDGDEHDPTGDDDEERDGHEPTRVEVHQRVGVDLLPDRPCADEQQQHLDDEPDQADDRTLRRGGRQRDAELLEEPDVHPDATDHGRDNHADEALRRLQQRGRQQRQRLGDQRTHAEVRRGVAGDLDQEGHDEPADGRPGQFVGEGADPDVGDLGEQRVGGDDRRHGDEDVLDLDAFDRSERGRFDVETLREAGEQRLGPDARCLQVVTHVRVDDRVLQVRQADLEVGAVERSDGSVQRSFRPDRCRLDDEHGHDVGGELLFGGEHRGMREVGEFDARRCHADHLGPQAAVGDPGVAMQRVECGPHRPERGLVDVVEFVE